VPGRRRWVAGAVWVGAAALLVGPGWALVAAVPALVLVGYLGRPRLAGLVTVGILVTTGAVIADVVRTERPWPNAGWPARFEWLHGLGLFAAVSLGIVAFAGPGRRQVAPPAGEVGSAIPPSDEVGSITPSDT
jgi:arabinofuranan 3-O-arabinosyltransferase